MLASIHDVGPRAESAVDALFDRLCAHLGGPRLAMLVVPDHWGEAPLAAAPAYQAKLRRWAEQGVEMFVHGWQHRDTSDLHGLAGWKARNMTAREGEFLGLDRADAAARMADGHKLIADIIGREPAGFIAPAWLYGPGALEALATSGFALAEDHVRVWRPVDGAVVARGPVMTWASRSPGRIRSSLFAARALTAVRHAMPTLRIAVHPGDVTQAVLLSSIDRAFGRAVRSHQPARYADLAVR